MTRGRHVHKPPPLRPSVAVIIGTRPEAIKMAPVLHALRSRGIAWALICTGQHSDLSLQMIAMGFEVDATLRLDSGFPNADAMCDAIQSQVAEWLGTACPDLVLVQGDTNSALAAARAARACGVAVGHVEAGLRTHDQGNPYPEERNRVDIDAFAELLFAPTMNACRNLEAEAVQGRIILTGNSGIDAVLDVASGLTTRRSDDIPQLLVTVHRRENRGAGLLAIVCGLHRIAQQERVRFILPLHPNSQARADMVAASAGLPDCTLLPPQSHCGMIALVLNSRVILTDSGGLQEEAPALGRPLLILRASTERPEAIDSGNALLVGTDPERIAAETLRLLHDEPHYARMSRPAFPFGRGGASDLIAGLVAEFLAVRMAGSTTAMLDRSNAGS